ncbi:hypothetical protein [Anaerococcus hydrogenalis]|uniref:hypothetical protein n=1 Tax=Anaerococcus hydrogenalis TaxID=33029 RepID=UPI0023F20F2D|nr:hypothetical protein [Anaerococcus hydrogenalis]
MAKDNLKTKFYKFIYKLDKENNKEEGKYTPDFDTWLKELNNQNKRKNTTKKKMSFGEAMSSLAKDEKKNKKTFDKSYKKVQGKNNKDSYNKKIKQFKKSSDIYSKQIEDYEKERQKIKLDKNELKKAIIYSEIIGKPKAKR